MMVKNKEAVDEAGSEAVPASVSVVGAEVEPLFSICRLLISRSNQVNIIGIYGMGGVGKTTLLTKIRGAMRTHFKLVIWVTISHEVKVFKIQQSICAQLGYKNLPSEERKRARFMSSVLSRKNAVLLLDDLWEKLDLAMIGIPIPHRNNNCKLVFTTRSNEVSIAMNAQESLKLLPLSESESWKLFSSEIIGDRVDLKNNPSIEPLAKEVVARCGGLPLTLVTVGRAMENATTVGEWKEAIKKLNDSPVEFQGMQNVFEILKFSYDRLRNDSLRWCLLFFVSFPEYLEIVVQDIVNYWVGEGILFAGDSSRHELHIQAYELVDELVAACLLEDCGDYHVSIHCGIYDMAVWIISSGENPVIFSYAGLGLTQFPIADGKICGVASLISLMHNNIETLLPDDYMLPDCPNLTSLLINDNPSMKKPIPESFFSSMPILRVLDLSYTGIEELPKSIGLLVQLHYLNLSATNIASLPEEIGNLKKLNHLRLWKTFKLETLPRREILKLSSLKCLDLSYSKYIWDEDISINNGTAAEDLEGACDQLEDLGLTIATSRFLKVLLSSHSWSNAIVYLSLQVKDLTISHLSTASESMKRLLDLHISNALELEELTLESGQFLKLQMLKLLDLPMLTRITVLDKNGQILPGLVCLEIGRCNLLRDFSWVHQVSTLTDITLKNCNGLEELLLHDGNSRSGDETECSLISCSFPNLKVLELGWLPNLRSISRCPLLLPSLQVINVYGCPKLKRLPFVLGSAVNIKKIQGFQRWWDRLVWKSDTIKALFLPCFILDDEHSEENDEGDDDGDDDDEGEGSGGRYRKMTRSISL